MKFLSCKIYLIFFVFFYFVDDTLSQSTIPYPPELEDNNRVTNRKSHSLTFQREEQLIGFLKQYDANTTVIIHESYSDTTSIDSFIHNLEDGTYSKFNRIYITESTYDMFSNKPTIITCYVHRTPKSIVMRANHGKIIFHSNISYFINQDLIEGMNVIADEDLSFEEKDEIAQFILRHKYDKNNVNVYGVNGTLLEIVEVETFLKRLKFGEYEDSRNFDVSILGEFFEFKKVLDDENNRITRKIDSKSNLDHSQKLLPDENHNMIAGGGELVVAIEKAMNGQETKFVRVDGHEFHIKPINVVKGRGAAGTISHYLSERRDDQISYRITLKKDGTHHITFNIDDYRGGFFRTYCLGCNGKLIPYADQGGKIIDGNWEASVETIINTIAFYIE